VVGKPGVALETLAAAAADHDALLVTAVRMPTSLTTTTSEASLSSTARQGRRQRAWSAWTRASLLMYGETQNVFHFLLALTTQVTGKGGLGLFLLKEVTRRADRPHVRPAVRRAGPPP
jgi:hypothetical protein